MSTRPYRIFHLIKGLGRGGAETLLTEGLRCSDRDHFEYAYGYFLPWKNALVSSLEEQKAEVVCFQSRGPTSILLSVQKVARHLRHWDADLVHCHLPLAGVAGRLAGRIAGIPVVYTEHNVLERYHCFTRQANLLTWNLQNRVIAVSHEVAASIRKYAGDRISVTVVQNGIPADAFLPSEKERTRIRESLQIPLDAPVVGTVSVFRMQKNLTDWLKAARLVIDRFPNAHFLLVGDGPLRADLHSAASALNLNGAVHFPGLQASVMPFYSAMDLYMNSSIFEGLPLALLEAMASRLPVVATSVGGVPEVVEEGKTGFLVAPKSPQALADKACLLLANQQLCRDFGEVGRTVVEKTFSMKKMVGELEQIYTEVLEEFFRRRSNPAS